MAELVEKLVGENVKSVRNEVVLRKDRHHVLQLLLAQT